MREFRWKSVRVSADGFSAQAVGGELIGDVLCESGVVAPWRLLALLGDALYRSQSRGFLNYPQLVSYGYQLVTLRVTCRYHAPLWRITSLDKFPFRVVLDVNRVGQTSLMVTSQLTKLISGSPQELVTSSFRLVNVHTASGKPCRLPLDLPLKAGLLQSKHDFTGRTDFQYVPPAVASHDVTVTEDDVIEGHTNQAAYVRLCRFNMSASVVVQEMDVIYLGPSFLGDRLKVMSWNPQDDVSARFYVIKRQRESSWDDIFKAVVWTRPIEEQRKSRL